MRKILYTIWEIGEVFFIAIIAIAAIKTFLIQPFIVNGQSMEPNFSDGNYLLVDEISYRFSDPARGDVVIFKYPKDPSVYYIKRIIGLPGERVEVDDSRVKIYNKENPNGFYLQESYLPAGLKNSWSGHVSLALKDNQYFVMGDNRFNSLDSRYWGPLDRQEIIGLVKLRLWPLSEAASFSTPTYSQQN